MAKPKRKRDMRRYIILLARGGTCHVRGPYKTDQARNKVALAYSLQGPQGTWERRRVLLLNSPWNSLIHPEDQKPFVDEFTVSHSGGKSVA